MGFQVGGGWGSGKDASEGAMGMAPSLAGWVNGNPSGYR